MTTQRQAFVVPAAAEPHTIQLPKDEYLVISGIVGGYVEVWTLGDHTAWVNEEAALDAHNYEFNQNASVLCGRNVLGNAVFMGLADRHGNTLGLTSAQLARLKHRIGLNGTGAARYDQEGLSRDAEES